MYVGVDIVSHPVRDTRAHGYRTKTVAISGDKGRNVAALAPAHRTHAILVHHALGDEIVDAGDHVRVVAQTEIAYVQGPEFLAISGRAAIIWLQHQRSFG